jgi:hypothetical protein
MCLTIELNAASNEDYHILGRAQYPISS